MLQFKKVVSVESNEDQAEVEDDINEEDIDNMNLDDEKKRHCRMVSKDNYGGVDDAEALIYAKR